MERLPPPGRRAGSAADQTTSAAAAARQKPGLRSPAAAVTPSSPPGRDPPSRPRPVSIVRPLGFTATGRLLSFVGVVVANSERDGALAAGVPLVVGSGSPDKSEMPRRVAWPGLGLRTGAPKQACIARAVREVTARPAVRTGARELGAAPTATGGVHPAADLLAALPAR